MLCVEKCNIVIDMRRKVLFLIESLSGGGAEKVLTVMLKHFDHERYEVTVCPIVDTGVYRSEVRSYVTHYFPILTYDGVAISRLLNRIKYKLIYDILPLSWVYKLFIPKGNDVEIAFCEGYVTKLLAHACSKSKKTAWVHIDLKENPWPEKLGFYKDAEEERLAYSRYGKIVCVSRTVEQSFLQKYRLPGQTTTIYNPIDVEDILEHGGRKENVTNGAIHIISVGRLVNQKGYDRLLKVVYRLHKEGHNLNLLILGEGSGRKNLEEYIAQYDMQQYVSLPGFKENPYRDMRSSDLFVCSSRSEGFSLVIAEAMVLGLPVISTYCSGPNELLGEGKYGILTENSEEGLYSGLKGYLTGELTYPDVDSQALSARFRPENVLNQIYELIDEE